LHVDELDKNLHLSATYIEFIEAYARCCEEASIGEMITYDSSHGDAESDNEDYPRLSVEERKSLPLHVKIENTIPALIHNCADKNF
jgi:hypothetical protein